MQTISIQFKLDVDAASQFNGDHTIITCLWEHWITLDAYPAWLLPLMRTRRTHYLLHAPFRGPTQFRGALAWVQKLNMDQEPHLSWPRPSPCSLSLQLTLQPIIASPTWAVASLIGRVPQVEEEGQKQDKPAPSAMVLSPIRLRTPRSWLSQSLRTTPSVRWKKSSDSLHPKRFHKKGCKKKLEWQIRPVDGWLSNFVEGVETYILKS